MRKRSPAVQLSISLWSAKEFLEKLCEIYPKVRELEEKMEESEDDSENDAVYKKFKELRTFQRALWVALIVEIGRLFDTFRKPNKEIISLKQTEFFKIPAIKNQVNSIFGQRVISRIIHTRNTYTAHMSVDKGDVVSVPEICKSNLGRLLSEIEVLVSQLSTYSKNEEAI